MRIIFSTDNKIEELEKQLLELNKDEITKGILLLTCDGNNYPESKINQLLSKIEKPVFGGIFPAIIHNEEKHESGFILAGFDVELEINYIENISTSEKIESDIMNISAKYSQSNTMFVFIDGLANQINNFIESIFSIFGLEYNYIGGGAGSLSLQQKPCIFTNNGLMKDCAIIASTEMKSGIGVKHGWKSIAGPFRVTSAKNTEIKEINFQPAFELYKNQVDQYSDIQISESNFFDIAKAFPFGINKFDAEKVIRDPIGIGESKSLICVGEVKNGDFVDILSGQKNNLIEASGKALQQAIEYKDKEPENFIFFIDCISRVLFLQDDFKYELQEVNKYYIQLPLIGALTIGEIANNGKEYLEFYNKTAVVGCF